VDLANQGVGILIQPLQIPSSSSVLLSLVLLITPHTVSLFAPMSKISFTVSVPHDGPHIPQFSVSCNNATYLSFKGKDIGNARFGNGNIVPKKGWKRLEFGVTGGVAATRVSVMVNTSVILPPLAWSTPGPAPAASVARGGSTATKKDCELFV